MNYYPILKKWSFENKEVFSDGSKDVIEKALNELSDIENFILNDSDPKFILKLKWHLKGIVFGRQGFPDNSEISTSNIVAIEKTIKLDKVFGMERALVATTESGSKYELYTDDGINIDKSVIQQLL